MICEIVAGLVAMGIFVTNAISFVLGYMQREMELRNDETYIER